jgi:hypothetical protein
LAIGEERHRRRFLTALYVSECAAPRRHPHLDRS